LFVVAHGESWEINASRTVGEIVEKVLAEHYNARKENPEQAGTFELHYKPADRIERSFSVPLPAPWSQHLIKNEDFNNEKYWSGSKDDQNRLDVSSVDVANSRH
jgi:hypothetical protein